MGKFHIPSTWVEGGMLTYERTGSYNPTTGKMFAMEITYRTPGGDGCTARFASEDAFHWDICASAKM